MRIERESTMRQGTFQLICTLVMIGSVVLASKNVQAADPYAYVVNSVGETVSKINLTTGTVTNHILTLGSDVSSAPNQILIYGERGFVTNSLTNELQVIDIAAESTLTFWPMPTGSNPYWMSIYDNQTIFVSLTLLNSIARVNLQTGAIVGIDSVGVSPQQMLIHNHLLYISNTGLDYVNFTYGQGTVSVWDIRGDSLLTVISVGTNPQQLSVDADNRIHVICTGNYTDQFGIVYVIDQLSRTVTDSMPTGGSPGGLTMTDDNKGWLAAGGFATSGELYAYDAATLTLFHDASNPVPTGLGCTGVESWKNNSVFAITFANRVERYEADYTAGPAYTVGSGPSSLAINYLPGDVDGTWSVDIADLTRMVDHLFISFETFESPRWRGDVDGELGVDIGDLTRLIDHLFGSFAPLFPGAPWLR